jgi:hypothetical protein
MKEKQQKYKRFIYFTQGYIHNIKISEAHGAMRVDASCWRSIHFENVTDKLVALRIATIAKEAGLKFLSRNYE